MVTSQYSIVLVNLDPTVGSEIKKTRPCVVISPNEMNKYLRTVVIAPMTSSSKKYPSRVDIIHNKKKGKVVLDQIRSIDKSRIVRLLGKATEKEVTNIKLILKETYID